MSESERRLAAIMFTDMVGYTALGQRSESLSLALVEEQRKVIRPVLTRHSGREVKTIGDAFLVEFSNAMGAVRCAYDIQRTIREFNLSLEPEKRIHLRIGIHVGDVVESRGDISGDAVNVASRIEPMAEDGGVCITRQVFDHIQNKVDIGFLSLGPRALKNVTLPVELYRMVMPWQRETPSEELDKRRIAVLPFASLSPDPTDEYFADGLTEELIDRLCQVKQLEVIARTSVMNYKGEKKSALQIGRELKAGALVEGSVRKAGNRIRVTAQLIDAKTESHMWSSKYDRDLQDVFAVQTDIAEQVAGALEVELLPAERRALERKQTDSYDAISLYMKGRLLLTHWERASLEAAAGFLEQAIAADPSYAAAYSALSNVYARMGFQDIGDRDENFRKVATYAQRALDLDGTLSDAHVAKSRLYFADYDFRASERELRRAIELNPSDAIAHEQLGFSLHFSRRSDELERTAEKALALDPLSVEVVGGIGTLYLYEGRYERAVALLENALALDPSNSFYLDNLGLAHMKQGMIEQGLSEVVRASEMSNEHKRDLAYAYVQAGRSAEATKILDSLDTSGPAVSATDVAGVYAALGEKEKALDWIERAYAEKSPYLPAVEVDFVFESIWKEPRFLEIQKKMGIQNA